MGTMKSKIVITNINNIDFDKMRVIDDSKIEERIYDSKMDVFTFENVKSKQLYRGCLINVSLYDDLIVEGEEKFKILHMLTKDNFKNMDIVEIAKKKEISYDEIEIVSEKAILFLKENGFEIIDDYELLTKLTKLLYSYIDKHFD